MREPKEGRTREERKVLEGVWTSTDYIFICDCLSQSNWFLLSFFLPFSIFWLHQAAHGILDPWPGIEPMPPTMQVWSLNHWITREVPKVPDSFLTGKFASPTIPSHHLKKWEFWVCHNKTLQIEKLKQHKFGGWKPKTRVLEDLVPGENPLPGFQMATFSLFSHGREKQALVSFPFLTRAQIPSWEPYSHNLN